MRKVSSSNGRVGAHDGARSPAVTVYCSASTEAPMACLELASRVGRELARRRWRLVYGGGSLGLMGACASGALAAGGLVAGVTTIGLDRIEPAHPCLTHLEVVETMHQRKLRMTELGDAFLVLPGGFGTLDETFEALTWRQLGIHQKPIVLLNHEGYFDALLAFVDQAVERGFVRPGHRSLLRVARTVGEAMTLLAAELAPERVGGSLDTAAGGPGHTG